LTLRKEDPGTFPCQAVTALRSSSVSFQIKLPELALLSLLKLKYKQATQTDSKKIALKKINCHLSSWHQKWSRSMLCLPSADGLQGPSGGQNNNQELNPNYPLSFEST